MSVLIPPDPLTENQVRERIHKIYVEDSYSTSRLVPFEAILHMIVPRGIVHQPDDESYLHIDLPEEIRKGNVGGVVAVLFLAAGEPEFLELYSPRELRAASVNGVVNLHVASGMLMAPPTTRPPRMREPDGRPRLVTETSSLVEDDAYKAFEEDFAQCVAAGMPARRWFWRVGHHTGATTITRKDGAFFDFNFNTNRAQTVLSRGQCLAMTGGEGLVSPETDPARFAELYKDLAAQEKAMAQTYERLGLNAFIKRHLHPDGSVQFNDTDWAPNFDDNLQPQNTCVSGFLHPKHTDDYIQATRTIAEPRRMDLSCYLPIVAHLCKVNRDPTEPAGLIVIPDPAAKSPRLQTLLDNVRALGIQVVFMPFDESVAPQPAIDDVCAFVKGICDDLEALNVPRPASPAPDTAATEAAKAAERANRVAIHDALMEAQAKEKKAAEVRRKLQAIEARTARAAAPAKPYTAYRPPPSSCKTAKKGARQAKRANDAEADLVHQIHILPEQRELRAQAFYLRQELHSTEVAAEKAKQSAKDAVALAKRVSAAREAATHVVPQLADISAVFATLPE